MANQPKKYKKFVATAATATLVASAIVPVASAKSFSDVAENNEFQPFIDALSDAGIINGYPDGTFKPGAKLTRGQVVKMLGRWVESNGAEVPADWDSVQRFNDVPVNSADQELVKYAALVKDAGVFTGSNGNLLAGNNITRQQMAKVLNGAYTAVNGVSLVDLADNIDNKLVTDLASAQQEFEGYIQALVDLEISTVSVFRPSENVTRAQFAKFLYNTIELEAVGAAGVKAINNTTVEVTFDGEIADIKALDFAIEGLEVKNAVVKQTDKKTAVLTTSAQEAGKEYTVTEGDNVIGKFTGIAAVIPTKVELVSTSVQGKLGQEVTVQAKVTVAEGQSAAGIPVTFNATSTNPTLNAPQVVEALTDANGVATYTYTRYAAGNDTVVAYATGDRSKFATGYVFWGVDTILSVEEVTQGSTINNGANKTYKVTFKDSVTGKPVQNKTLNVSVLENINVTPDKLSNTVRVNGTPVSQLSNGTAPVAAQIITDSKGEATFTVTGLNTEVTPVVFEANNTTNTNGSGPVYDYKYDASDLQVVAAKVKFAAIQAEYTIELTRDGGEVAAINETNGREYKVLVKDKDGKVAANETVNIAFNEDLDRVMTTNTSAGFVNPDTELFYNGEQGNTRRQISVKTNAKGEASFIIASNTVNDYATPVAWIDVNSPNAARGSLDEGETKTVGAITYFQAAYLDGAAIKAYKTTGGKATDKFTGLETAEFRAELVNQSGKVIASGYTVGNVTYTVTNTGANDVDVHGQTVSPNRSYTITLPGNQSLRVASIGNKTTSVKVVATGSARQNNTTNDFAFTAKEATATFTSTTAVVDTFTGVVASFDTGKKEITLKDANGVAKDPVKYAGESGKTYEYYGGNGALLADADAFIAELKSVPSGKQVVITRQLVEDKVIYKVVRQENGTAPVDTVAVAAAEGKAVQGLTFVDTDTTTSTVAAQVQFTAETTTGATGYKFELTSGATTTALTGVAGTSVGGKLVYNLTAPTGTTITDGDTITVTPIYADGSGTAKSVEVEDVNTSVTGYVQKLSLADFSTLDIIFTGATSKISDLTVTQNGTTISLAGTANKATGFTAFAPTDLTLQEGYFVALKFVEPDGGTSTGTITGEVNGTAFTGSFDGAGYFYHVQRLDAYTATGSLEITVDWPNGSKTYTIDLSGVTFN